MTSPNLPKRRMVTILEACAEVHKSRRTMYNWMEKGLVETVRLAGGSTLIYADSLYRDKSGEWFDANPAPTA